MDAGIVILIIFFTFILNVKVADHTEKKMERKIYEMTEELKKLIEEKNNV